MTLQELKSKPGVAAICRFEVYYGTYVLRVTNGKKYMWFNVEPKDIVFGLPIDIEAQLILEGLC